MFNKESIEKHFAKMGARVKVRDLSAGRWGSSRSHLLDVRTDKKGEYFDVGYNPEDDPEMLIINVDPADRHLVVLFKDSDGNKERFLCGHDERSWFVAAVPGGANTVWEAKEALKPPEARESQERKGVRKQKKHKRHNEGYVRQGEWFFIPHPNMEVSEDKIIRNEPIRRGRGKAHMVEEVFRSGGTTVHRCWKYPDGLTEEKYKELIKKDPSAKAMNWTVMRRDAAVFCRGKVSHPDHATIELTFWHRVIPNTESNASWSTNMAFLD